MAGRTDIRSLLQDFLGANPEEDAEKLRTAQAKTREQVGQERFSQQMGSAVDALGAGLTRSPVPRARALTAQPTATQELDEQSRQAREHAKQRIDAAGALNQVEERAAKAQLDAQGRLQTSAAQEEMRRSMREALKRDGLDDASIDAMVRNPKMYEAWARGQEAQRGRAFTAGENAKSRANARAIAEQRAVTAGQRGTKAPAKRTGNIPVTVAATMGDYVTAGEILDNLSATRKKKIGAASALTQYLPGTDAKQYEDERRVAAQAFGLVMEGGKLAEGDLVRYMAMLPDAADSDERAAAKIAAVKQAMEIKRRNQIEALSASGYDMGAFSGQSRPPAQSGQFSVEAGAAPDTSSDDDAALEWAEQNRSDPRALEILRANGRE